MSNPQYITDSAGHKISVILPIEEYAGLMEDLEDLAAVVELKDEETIPWAEVKKELLDNGQL